MLPLALGAALCAGVVDFIAGMRSRQQPAAGVVLTMHLSSGPVFLAVTLLTGSPLPATPACLAAILAGVFGGVGIALFYRALAVGTVAVVAPVVACCVYVPIAVGLVAGGPLGVGAMLGIGVAMAGMALVATHSGGGFGGEGFGLALLAAATIGAYMAILGLAAQESLGWTLVFSRVGSIGVLTLYMRTRRGADGESARPVFDRGTVALGLVDGAATAMFAAATVAGDLSKASVVIGAHAVIPVLLAYMVLGQRPSARQLTGAAALISGVALTVSG